MLQVGPDNIRIPLQFGAIDPITELSGVRGRLNNLGYKAGPPDGIPGQEFHRALELFQQRHGLPPTCEPDRETVGKLREVHGS